MTVLIISLVVGFALGCFVNYAVTFNTGKARNIWVCLGGAVVGGAIVPWVLQMPTFWPGLIGSLVGVAIVLYVTFRLSLSKS